MRVFDLHCDTVSTAMNKKSSLFENNLHIDLKRGLKNECWVQTFAFWIDDIYKGESAWENLLAQHSFFKEQFNKNKDKMHYFDGEVKSRVCNYILSVEGGRAIAGKIDRIKTLKEMGISFFTLVWNGKNELASGVLAKGGLTDLGKKAVDMLEKEGIIIDVSHLNEQGFYDLASIAKKPFVATHSNAYSICPHKRNLKNEQIKHLITSGGIIGINLYPLFVNGKDDYTIDEIIKHIEHILALGGENTLALGTDFDGADMPKAINQITALEKLYNSMVRYYNEDLTEKIMFNNAYRFARENINF